jgi:hypothetical protein
MAGYGEEGMRMIEEIIVGDITSFENKSDIIIGMNSTLEDVTGIGLPFVREIRTVHPVGLGTVLSFRFDESGRDVHMIICHDIGFGGWEHADRYVRFGMDYLWQKSLFGGAQDAPFSIVQIGTGAIGKRDGADPAAIRKAIAESHLSVSLFVLDRADGKPAARVHQPLRALSAWSPLHGEEQLMEQ